MGNRRINPPFRAEHIGSLLRPDVLIKAREDFQSGAISGKQLSDLEDECIRDVVAMQESLGLQSISDGEFRQRSWFHDFVLGMRGTAIKLGDFAIDFTSDKGERRPTPTPYVEDKIRRKKDGITIERFVRLKSFTKHTAKLTISSPTVVHFFSGTRAISRDAYPDITMYFNDLVEVYQQEIADLAARGCTYLQLDEVPLALLCDPKIREAVRANGDDPEELARTYTQLINRAIEKRPATLTVGMHLCRGNNRGHWLGQGGYEPIAETIFDAIGVDTLLLEYDSERAGDFKPLRYVGNDKVIVLGLLSTKTPQLESRDDLKRRIEEASNYVPMEQLALSPQCGFASNFLGNPITFDDQKRKLELVVSLATEVWGHA